MNDLYFSPNVIRVIRSRRMRGAGHVARVGKRRGVYRVLVEKPEGKNNLVDPVVDGKIVLKWIFRMWDGGTWTGLIWLRTRKGGWHLLRH